MSRLSGTDRKNGPFPLHEEWASSQMNKCCLLLALMMGAEDIWACPLHNRRA